MVTAGAPVPISLTMRSALVLKNSVPSFAEACGTRFVVAFVFLSSITTTGFDDNKLCSRCPTTSSDAAAYEQGFGCVKSMLPSRFVQKAMASRVPAFGLSETRAYIKFQGCTRSGAWLVSNIVSVTWYRLPEHVQRTQTQDKLCLF